VAIVHVKIDNLNDLVVGFYFIRSIDMLDIYTFNSVITLLLLNLKYLGYMANEKLLLIINT
jgi:hypothetical protein